MKQIDNWSPLYFLSALGAGGMIVTFFMYLLFWIPHPDQPIPVFSDWVQHLQTSSFVSQVIIIVALTGILLFSVLHFYLLYINQAHYKKFKADGGVEKIMGSNAHTQIMALPLTYAMTVNAVFILGAVFIPGLWQYSELLFPIAMLILMAIGIWASRIYLCFFSHVLHHGSFDSTINNSLAQLLPTFAFAMVAVGLSSPASLSHSHLVIGISYLLSMFFLSTSLFLGLIKLTIGMGDAFREGASRTTLPTFWIIIPILTISGIAIMRLSHGMHTLGLGEGATNSVLLVIIFSIQIMFALMGWSVMKRMEYFKYLLNREENSPVVFALICPGVSLVVMGHFVINKVLVNSNMIDNFGMAYIFFSATVILLQFATGWLLVRLTRDHFGNRQN